MCVTRRYDYGRNYGGNIISLQILVKWLRYNMYQKGYYMTTNNSPFVKFPLQEVENFIVRPEDIIIASFPKSGTTWAQEIVHQVSMLQASKHKITHNTPSSQVNVCGTTQRFCHQIRTQYCGEILYSTYFESSIFFKFTGILKFNQ